MIVHVFAKASVMKDHLLKQFNGDVLYAKIKHQLLSV